MVEIVTTVKNTFVHVDDGNPDVVETDSNARRRASSAPARVALDREENEKFYAQAFGAQGSDELLLLPHDADDYTSMHSHPGPSPLDMDVEGMFGSRASETDVDDDVSDRSIAQAEDETASDYVTVNMEIDDTLREEMEYYSASASAYQGVTYGAQLPNGSYRQSLAQYLPCSSAAYITSPKPAQRKLFSTFPIPPSEAQRDSDMQTYSRNSRARGLCNVKHEATEGEEKRTTVMLMNVPRRYTSSKLMSSIDAEGFANMYDFLYVPLAAARGSKGYAFVNWVNPSIAQRFLSAFNGFSGWSIASKNVCQAVWAKQQQGLQTNVDRYRNRTVLGKSVPDEYKPRIFQNGEEVPFPPPTRKASKPTLRDAQPRKHNSQQTFWL